MTLDNKIRMLVSHEDRDFQADYLQAMEKFKQEHPVRTGLHERYVICYIMQELIKYGYEVRICTQK